jgi:hypothetical protein
MTWVDHTRHLSQGSGRVGKVIGAISGGTSAICPNAAPARKGPSHLPIGDNFLQRLLHVHLYARGIKIHSVGSVYDIGGLCRKHLPNGPHHMPQVSVASPHAGCHP